MMLVYKLGFRSFNFFESDDILFQPTRAECLDDKNWRAPPRTLVIIISLAILVVLRALLFSCVIGSDRSSFPYFFFCKSVNEAHSKTIVNIARQKDAVTWS
jgi:hypothetical protein